MAKTQVWTPEDGFTRKSKPGGAMQKPKGAVAQPAQQNRLPQRPVKPRGKPAPKPDILKQAPPIKSAQAAQEVEAKETTSGDTTVPEQIGKKVERKLRWLNNNRIEGEYSVAEKYINKQIREKTPMVFHGYDGTLHCQIARLWKYNLNLLVDGRQQSYSKLRLACYYKERDAAAVSEAMGVSPEIQARKLEPVVPRGQRYPADDVVLKESAKKRSPIFVALRTGHLFKGYVRWFTPHEIRLILSNGVKVHIFRHALLAVKTDVQVKARPEPVDESGNANQATEATQEG
jgi:sRNA-binding regulator protein Hfq